MEGCFEEENNDQKEDEEEVEGDGDVVGSSEA